MSIVEAAEHNQTSSGLADLAAGGVHERDAAGAWGAACREEVTDRRAGTDAQPPGRPRRGDGRPHAGEARVYMPLLEDRKATGRDQPAVGPIGRHPFGHLAFRPGQRPRADEASVWKLRQPFPCAMDTQEPLDAVVVGRQIGVADRPNRPIAVATGRLQFEVGQAQGHPAPEQRPAAELAPADPHERPAFRRFVRLRGIADEQVRILFPVDGVQLLHRLRSAYVSPEPRDPRPGRPPPAAAAADRPPAAVPACLPPSVPWPPSRRRRRSPPRSRRSRSRWVPCPLSEVAAAQVGYRQRARACGERHDRQRRPLPAAGGPACAVGDQHVGHSPAAV